MDVALRIEQELEAAISRAAGSDCPPILAEALHYAVFPGGARIRPRLCLAVAMACQPTLPPHRRTQGPHAPRVARHVPFIDGR